VAFVTESEKKIPANTQILKCFIDSWVM